MSPMNWGSSSCCLTTDTRSGEDMGKRCANGRPQCRSNINSISCRPATPRGKNRSQTHSYRFAQTEQMDPRVTLTQDRLLRFQGLGSPRARCLQNGRHESGVLGCGQATSSRNLGPDATGDLTIEESVPRAYIPFSECSDPRDHAPNLQDQSESAD